MHNFDETWGPVRPHNPNSPLSEESELALSRLQARPSGKLSGWLSNLIEVTPTEDKEPRVDTWLPQRYALIEASARSWIDAIFAELNKFVWEVNSSAASEKMTIVTENPKSTIELRCRRDPSSEPYRFVCYQGHLATHEWALLLRSYYESLQVFIMRSDLLLGLEFDRLSTNDLKPVAEFRAAVNGDDVQWALADNPVSKAAIPAMARELFEDFINVALGKMEESDLFLPAHTKKPSDVKVLHEEKTDQFLAVLKDLQAWQIRDITTKAINQDLGALMKVSLQPELKLANDSNIELLHSQYVELQRCWNNLLSSLQKITSDIEASNDSEHRDLDPSLSALNKVELEV